MTSQPYTPQFESPTEPSADSSGAPDTISEFDPDIVVLDDDDVEDVTGVTAPQGSHVLTEPGLDEPAGNEPVLSEQWHDIQAMFVDDPQGSVDRAAAAADDAVGALVAVAAPAAAGGPGWRSGRHRAAALDAAQLPGLLSAGRRPRGGATAGRLDGSLSQLRPAELARCAASAPGLRLLGPGQQGYWPGRLLAGEGSRSRSGGARQSPVGSRALDRRRSAPR